MSFEIDFWFWIKPDELYISVYQYRSFLISCSLQLFLIASEVRISKEYRDEQRHRKEVQMEHGLHWVASLFESTKAMFLGLHHYYYYDDYYYYYYFSDSNCQ